MTVSAALPPDLAGRLAAETRGERVLWVGQPTPSRAMRPLLKLLPLTIPLLLLAIAFLLVTIADLAEAAPRAAADPSIQIILLPTSVAATALATFFVALPWVKGRRAAHTVYALTDRRLVSLARGDRAARSFGPERLVGLQRVEHEHGLGSLFLSFAADTGGVVGAALDLHGVPQAARLEALLRHAQARAFIR